MLRKVRTSLAASVFLLSLGQTLVVEAQNNPASSMGSELSRATEGSVLNYSLSKTISGRVVRADGSAVKTRFYVQDISQSPPQLVATYESDADGSYAFQLDIGQWRVVPVSAEFRFQPRAREYDTRLNLMGRRPDRR